MNPNINITHSWIGIFYGWWKVLAKCMIRVIVWTFHVHLDLFRISF